MWEIPERPISGVENCHAEGIYSFVFEDDLRMFACLNWTPLAANDYGDTVGYHDHHVDLTIKVAFGEIENIAPYFVSSSNGTKSYTCWNWDSTLRGGRGKFAPLPGIDPMYVKYREIRTLTRNTEPLSLPSVVCHTVKQTTKKVGWFVKEGRRREVSSTVNYSRNDLTDWHKTAEYYRPLEGDALIEAWNEVRGLAINAKKRNRN